MHAPEPPARWRRCRCRCRRAARFDLTEDSPGGSLIREGHSAPSMSMRQGGQAFGVEAGDEMGDGVAGAAAHGMGRGLGVVTACDGSLKFIKNSIDFAVYRALFTRAGSEIISSDSY